jgi:hypothetical protein
MSIDRHRKIPQIVPHRSLVYLWQDTIIGFEVYVAQYLKFAVYQAMAFGSFVKFMTP